MDNKFYTWIAKSNDESFTDESCGVFPTMEECYNDMRNAVLEKMKWNTEWEDVNEDESTIGYKVHFGKTSIKHESYSGTYLYKIVPCDECGKVMVKEFMALNEELGIKRPVKTEDEIYAFFTTLVHGRYSNDELEKNISQFMGKEIHLEDCTDNDKTYDYMLTCQLYGDYDNEVGYFLDADIFYLPTRYGHYYITEVNVQKY